MPKYALNQLAVHLDLPRDALLPLEVGYNEDDPNGPCWVFPERDDKRRVVGLMRSYANQLAPYSIRVNSVHPAGVNTPMIANEAMREFLADPQMSHALSNALPVEVLEPVDISNAILWLVSDDARYVTGITLPVDAGFTNKK